MTADRIGLAVRAVLIAAVGLWIGTLITVLAVIVTGAMHFNPRVAFDFPPGAFDFSLGFFLGLGAVVGGGRFLWLFALLGLGTPYWDYGARGTLLGLTRPTPEATL